MKINDYLLCTFEDDNEIPKNTYVAKILDVDTTNSKLDCEFVDTKQRIKFEFNLSGIWPGIDLLDGTNYGIDTHDIYSPTASSPVAEQVALVTFSDNAQYLCYVESIEDNTNVQFYHQPYPRIRISTHRTVLRIGQQDQTLSDNTVIKKENLNSGNLGLYPHRKKVMVMVSKSWIIGSTKISFA